MQLLVSLCSENMMENNCIKRLNWFQKEELSLPLLIVLLMIFMFCKNPSTKKNEPDKRG
jgi:hypothetical protein